MTLMKRQSVCTRSWFRLASGDGHAWLDVQIEDITDKPFVRLYYAGNVRKVDCADLTPRHARKLAQKLNEFADRAEKHMRKG